MPKTLMPMLADNKTKIDASILPQLKYPLLASPKYDGLRLRIDPSLGGVSRTHKPIPNAHLQVILAQNSWLHYFDGELIIGDPTAPDVFNKTQSAFMSHGGAPTINYYVFDHWQHPLDAYHRRLRLAVDLRSSSEPIDMRVHIVHQKEMSNPDDVLAYEEQVVSEGYEGLILRSIDGKYKNGRSTFNEGLLLKFKRREDSEGQIIGFQELMINNNEPMKDAFGYQRRSSHKAGKTPGNTLGALILHDPKWPGGNFTCGSGFDDALRDEIWQNKAKFEGKQCTYTFTPAGSKDLPRFPIFKGIRHD